MSKAALLEKLTDKEYRDAFISEEIDVGLPMQLRAMRESRNWSQKFVAEKTGTKQPRFSLMEKPGYGNFSLNTLKKLASLFDVGLIVSFVPFSEIIDFVESMTPARLYAAGFAAEYPRLLRRYSRTKHDETSTVLQASFDFEAPNTAQEEPEPVFLAYWTAPDRELLEEASYHRVPIELIADAAGTQHSTISLS